MSTAPCKLPPPDSSRVACIEQFGGQIVTPDSIGARVSGIDLSSRTAPPREVLDALEQEMAIRGFLVFKNEKKIGHEDFLRASCWWGGRELHSTHGIHPETPDGNRHIFRLSNDRRHGIPDVGPQWHNDGSFLPMTFSHSGYHIVRPAEHGGGTHFAHQGIAYQVLPDDVKEHWSRLSSVNSDTGVVHPLVHEHPISGHKCIWLHLDMTGAIIEKKPGDPEGFRLFTEDELTQLCRDYNDILNAGLEAGYTIAFEYEENDCTAVLSAGHTSSRPVLVYRSISTFRGTAPSVRAFGKAELSDFVGTTKSGCETKLAAVWVGNRVGRILRENRRNGRS